MYRQSGRTFNRFHNHVHIGKIKTGFYAAGMYVESERHDVDIAGAFAMSEECSLDAVCSGEKRHFGGGNGATLIVVGVDADGCFIQIFIFAYEILYHVRVLVWRPAFHGCRKVENGRLEGKDCDV